MTALTISALFLFALSIYGSTSRTRTIDANAISIRQDSGRVQWKLPDGQWQTLVTVAQLTQGVSGVDGKDGATGATGATGANGINGTNGVDGKDGADGADGTDGREIEIQKGTLYIQWRYVGDTTWNNIIAYSDLKGDKGDKGDTGETGAQGPAGTNGIGNSIQPINVSTTTAANTAAKVGITTGGGYVPAFGDILLLALTAANSASNPTLNIDGSGAKSILIGNMAPTNIAMAGTKVLLWYDGASYQLFGSQRAVDTDTNTTYTGITGATTTTTTATATLGINTFVIANYTAGKLMYTLPATAAVGTVVEVYAASSGGYRITAAAGDNILYPDGTSSGAAGWIETTQYGTIKLRCIIANTTWVISSNSKQIINNNGITYN